MGSPGRAGAGCWRRRPPFANPERQKGGGGLQGEGAKRKSVRAQRNEPEPGPRGRSSAARASAKGGRDAVRTISPEVPGLARPAAPRCGVEMNERLPLRLLLRAPLAAAAAAAASSCPNPGHTQSDGPAAPRSALPPPAPRRRLRARGLRLAEGQSRGARRAVELPRRGRGVEGPGSGAEGLQAPGHGRAAGRIAGGVPLTRPPLPSSPGALAASQVFFPFFFFSAQRS